LLAGVRDRQDHGLSLKRFGLGDEVVTGANQALTVNPQVVLVGVVVEHSDD